MSTLGDLKAEIADDLARTDLTSQIANAITAAIKRFQNRRFYFNETRSTTFTTADGQSTYSSSDSADIPKFARLDMVSLEDTNGEQYTLTPYSIERMESLLDNSAANGRPWGYLYFEESFRLYPTPDAAYTVRPIGTIMKDAPATDGEANNVWMTDAYELIRCRAKAYLAAHVLRDPELAQVMVQAEGDALSDLRERGTQRMSTGTVTRTTF